VLFERVSLSDLLISEPGIRNLAVDPEQLLRQENIKQEGVHSGTNPNPQTNLILQLHSFLKPFIMPAVFLLKRQETRT
jgi:hypothetical protein